MQPLTNSVVVNFGDAATTYDHSAGMQAAVAVDLIERANNAINVPQTILDIGCGTGLVSAAAFKKWPLASFTGLDGAPQMLLEAKRKIPDLVTIVADAMTYESEKRYDLIVSSMMLHWLLSPVDALSRWQRWLKPGGAMFVTLLVEGSFKEWRDLCRAEDQPDGIWPFPAANIFAGDGLAAEEKTFIDMYTSASDLMRYLKGIGAVTPAEGHERLSTGGLRRMLRHAPSPFKITYRVLYITMQSLGNV